MIRKNIKKIVIKSGIKFIKEKRMHMIWFDLMMAVLMFLFGFYFYCSHGKGANLLTGYNMRSKEERKKYNEMEMCKCYGKRMMIMAIPFLLGVIIDSFAGGIGCILAWVIWIFLFLLLLLERTKKEK